MWGGTDKMTGSVQVWRKDTQSSVQVKESLSQPHRDLWYNDHPLRSLHRAEVARLWCALPYLVIEWELPG